MRFTRFIPLFALFFSSFSYAQEPSSLNVVIEDSAKFQNYIIPIPSIPDATEETYQLISSVNRQMISSGGLLELDSTILFIEDTIKYYEQLITESYLNQSGLWVLERNIVELRQIQDMLDSYMEPVNNKIKELDKFDKKLDKYDTLWERFSKSERLADLSEAIKNNVTQVTTELSQTNKLLNQTINEYLEIQINLNQFYSRIELLLTRVTEVENKIRQNLLAPDSKPVWMIKSDITGDILNRDKWKELFESRKNNVIEYYHARKHNIFLTILVFIILQLIFFWLKKELNRTEHIDSSDFKNNLAIRIINQNYSTALIIGFLFTMLLLPFRPSIINLLLYILGFIPLVILFITITGRKFLINIVFLGIIFFLAIFSNVFPEFQFFRRFIYLLISVLFVFWLIHFIRTNKNDLHEVGYQKILIHFARVFLVLASITILANLLGISGLAILVLNGILRSLYYGIILFLFYQILISSMIVLSQMRYFDKSPFIQQYREKITKRIGRFLKTITFVIFFILFLVSFEIFQWIWLSIKDIFNHEIRIGEFTITLTDIFLFFVIILISRWISNLVKFLIGEEVFLKTRKQKDIGASISSILTFSIMTIGVIIAALAAGLELDKLTILVGAFGVGIGFGLQDIFNNLVSGIIIVFERPLQVGDTIEVGNLIGTVKTIGIRSSVVRTFDGSEVIVPNGILISKELINWTHSDQQRRITVNVGVEYGTDPEKVIEILEKVAEQHNKVISWPKPYVLFTQFGDSSLNFELRCWTDDYGNWIFVASDLHVKVNNALKTAGIVIPFPQRDIHIREKKDPDDQKVKNKE